MEKITSYDLGYRQGIRFALVGIMNLFKGVKWEKVPLEVFLNALYYNLDEFITYGDEINFVYTAYDKNKIPTKAIATHKSGQKYAKDLLVESLPDILKMRVINGSDEGSKGVS